MKIRVGLFVVAFFAFLFAMFHTEARAQTAAQPWGTASAAVEVIDQPPLTGTPSAGGPCANLLNLCSFDASQQGNFAAATASATIGYTTGGTFPGLGGTVLISPSIVLDGSAHANPNPNPDTIFTPFAGATATGNLQFGFTPKTLTTPGSGLQPINASLGGGTLSWYENFFFAPNRNGTPFTLQFNWGVSDSSGSAITGTFANLSCTFTCSITSEGAGITFSNGAEQTGVLTATLNLAHLTTIGLQVSEMVTLGMGADSLGISDPLGPVAAHFQDPMTLTYLDANGNIIPDLVLFDSNIDGIIPVSGQDLSPTTATPLPAALPLFATGLGALGLLGWRRKRKARAI